MKGLEADIDRRLVSWQPTVRRGRVVSADGTRIRARLSHACIDDLCQIEIGAGVTIPAQVRAFEDEEAILVPFDCIARVPSGAAVRCTGEHDEAVVGDSLRGRVVDALGESMDGKGRVTGTTRWPLMRPPPSPLARRPIERILPTGIRAVDGFAPLAVGQRVGVFAAAGGGKTTMLSSIARNAVVDRVVVALVGERSREIGEFVSDLGGAGLARTTVVASSSSELPQRRMRAAWTATAIAEEARSRGESVLLLVDSVTRLARALRDVGMAAGEMPGRQGYPPSVYTALPALFERAGNDDTGSITAVYTVLVAGDDLREPVADETMSLLDGHLVLSRAIAERGRFPALDVSASQSRLFARVGDAEHFAAAARVRVAIGVYEQNADKIQMGLFEPETELQRRMIELQPEIEQFLAQDLREAVPFETTRARVLEIAARIGG